jgi:hypothetical protein
MGSHHGIVRVRGCMVECVSMWAGAEPSSRQSCRGDKDRGAPCQTRL